MRTNAGQLPDTVSKWHINAELTHVVRELDMIQEMFNLNIWSPDEEYFTSSMQNTMLNSTLSTYIEPLPAILTPYVGWPIYEVTSMMTSLGDTEGQWQAKSIRAVKAPMGNQASKGPTQVTRIQMWTALLAMGLDKNKIVEQPNVVFLELWKQLRPEKQFTKYENMYSSARGLYANWRYFFWCPVFALNRGQAKVPTQRAQAGTRGSVKNLQFTGHAPMYKE